MRRGERSPRQDQPPLTRRCRSRPLGARHSLEEGEVGEAVGRVRDDLGGVVDEVVAPGADRLRRRQRDSGLRLRLREIHLGLGAGQPDEACVEIAQEGGEQGSCVASRIG